MTIDTLHSNLSLRVRTHTIVPSSYIEFDEMQIMAAQLGAPFNSEKEARKTWSQMDKNQTGRVKEEEFVEWWYNKEQDVLRKKLSEQLGFSTEKLGKGRGVVFG